MRMKTCAPLALIALAAFLCTCGDGSGGACEYDTDCPGTQVCENGLCVAPVRCPRVPCPPGEICVDERCYPKDCQRRQCPGLGEICIDEECVPASCLGVECLEGQACAADSRCYPVHCQTHFCDGYGEVCIDEECVQRSCVGVECPAEQACAGGHCYPSGCGVTVCAPEEICIDDVCVNRACVGVACLPGQRCQAGVCIGGAWPELKTITSGGGRLQLGSYRVDLFVAPVTPVGATSSGNYRVRLGPGAIRSLGR